MLWQKIWKHRILYFLFIPAIIYFITFRYYPMFLQVLLAFKQYNLSGGIWGSPWVGWGNFHQLLQHKDFQRVLQNTVEISLLRIVFGFFPPIVLAILLFDLASSRFRKMSQTVLYIPHFFSWVIVYAISYAMFANTGFLNQIMQGLTGHTIPFLTSEQWFRPILIGTGVWKDLGWGTIIYLAGLTALDPSLYEAAKIDGAGPIKRIVHVTLPGITSIIVFLFTIQIGSILYAGGEQILLFYNPVTYSVGDIIDTWVYRQGIAQLQYSMATAMSLFQSFFGLLLVIIANKAAKKYAGTGIW
ncbi:sugar ABC transporter permease [Cohnella endophytica]|uniref:Sugar ABC transporter permease n=1 Tax=Cohnella endophytica TaxID=2419778 RepID=A0A494Y1Q6_9BACL|nr:ABC transporter permease subunit [Cohnella endophytica]RKP54377.1 sugar ABC transporter permease [Cohnella endophytica]